MLWTVKAVLMLCCYTAVQCTIYPTFNWISSNPEFKGNATLYVEPFSQINFLCPHPAMIVKQQRFTHSIRKLYENIWLVDKEGYEKCKVNKLKGPKILKKHKLIGSCKSPTTLSYFTIAFEMYGGRDSLTFVPGKTYYLISTSNGHFNSLKKKSNGHCKTHNMRLRIYICKRRRECKALRNKKPTVCR